MLIFRTTTVLLWAPLFLPFDFSFGLHDEDEEGGSSYISSFAFPVDDRVFAPESHIRSDIFVPTRSKMLQAGGANEKVHTHRCGKIENYVIHCAL